MSALASLLRIAIGLAVAFTPLAARSAGRVSVHSSVFVERASIDAEGRQRWTLDHPATVSRGDSLLIVLIARNRGDAPAQGLVITNPVPGAVTLDAALSPDASVSVDGGRSWGPLGALSVRTADGRLRPAMLSDVTHVRWLLKQPLAPGAAARILLRGTVR